MNATQPQPIPAKNGNILVSAAIPECLQGVVFRCLKHPYPDEAWHQKLEQLYFQIAATNIRRLNALDIIEAELTKARIPVLAIKGVSMIDPFYPDIGMRFMEDMDLMVEASRRKAFGQVLSRIGYQQDGTFAHIYHKDAITIDVHTHPLNIDRIASRDFLPTSYLDSIWKEALPLKPGFVYLQRPADTDSFLLATHHLVKHSMSRLIWLFDLKQIVQDNDHRFWAQLSEKAVTYQQKRILAYGLFLLKTHLNIAPPDNSGIEKILPQLNRLEKGMLSLWGQTQQTADTGHLLWLLCLPTIRQKVAFLTESAFPKRSVLKQERPAVADPGRALYWHRSRLVITRLLENLNIIRKGLFRKKAGIDH